MQKTTRFKKVLSLLLCFVLIAAMALMTTGCKDNALSLSVDDAIDKTAIGEGNTQFTFNVIDQDGNQTAFLVHTDEKTVGDALMKINLIQGEDGPYGLYVKTVNGITLDFDKDGKYWAFYENGAYANGGVDTTAVQDGAVYAFKAE